MFKWKNEIIFLKCGNITLLVALKAHSPLVNVKKISQDPCESIVAPRPRCQTSKNCQMVFVGCRTLDRTIYITINSTNQLVFHKQN